jgi:hypothetical protein
MLQHTTGRARGGPVGRGGTTHQRRSAPPQIWGTRKAGKGGEGRRMGASEREQCPLLPGCYFYCGDGDRGDAQRNEHPALLCSAPLRSVSCEQCVRAASLSAAPAVSSYPFRSLPTPRTRWPLFLFGRPPLSREASAVQCSTVEEKKRSIF